MTVFVLNVRDGYEDDALKAIGRLIADGAVSAVHKRPPEPPLRPTESHPTRLSRPEALEVYRTRR